MNKKIFGISVGSIAAVMFAVLLTTSPTQQPQQSQIYDETFVPGLVPPPLPMSVFLKGDQVSTVDEASEIIGHEIKLPSYLPDGYSVQLISANEKEVKMYASPQKLTPDTKDQDFVWNQKGITISIMPKADSKVADEVEDMLNKNSEYSPIQIGTTKAVGNEIKRFDNGDGIVSSSQAELLYYENDLRIVIHGLHPLERLASVAVSLTE